jgi:hypothetical protein
MAACCHWSVCQLSLTWSAWRVGVAAPGECTMPCVSACRSRPGVPVGPATLFSWTWAALAAGFSSKPAAAGEEAGKTSAPAAGRDGGIFGPGTAARWPAGDAFTGARRNAGRDAGNRRSRW